MSAECEEGRGRREWLCPSVFQGEMLIPYSTVTALAWMHRVCPLFDGCWAKLPRKMPFLASSLASNPLLWSFLNYIAIPTGWKIFPFFFFFQKKVSAYVCGNPPQSRNWYFVLVLRVWNTHDARGVTRSITSGKQRGVSGLCCAMDAVTRRTASPSGIPANQTAPLHWMPITSKHGPALRGKWVLNFTAQGSPSGSSAGGCISLHQYHPQESQSCSLLSSAATASACCSTVVKPDLIKSPWELVLVLSSCKYCPRRCAG